jgi:molybdate transport system ATP-binding protein
LRSVRKLTRAALARRLAADDREAAASRRAGTSLGARKPAARRHGGPEAQRGRASPRAGAGVERPEPTARHRGDADTARRPGTQPLIELAGVDLYVEYRRVLREVNWTLGDGEHWAVLGANGAGKTSFLKLLYGDLAPALGGSIERRGFPPGTPIADWKRGVGYVSPELQTDYLVDVSIRDLVVSGRHASIGLAEAPTAADLASGARWLRFFNLSSVAERRPRELSYGQLRRALLARALAAEPRLLLLDEPLTGLDPRQRALIKRLLARLMRSRLCVVIAVHHPEDLPRGMTHELRLSGGRAAVVHPHSAN